MPVRYLLKVKKEDDSDKQNQPTRINMEKT